MNRNFLSFFAASRTRSSPLDPLSRLCVRRWLDCSAFSLANRLPSTTSADGLPPLFGCFAGTTPLYDSSGLKRRALKRRALKRRALKRRALKRRAAVRVGLIAHRLLPPARFLAAAGGNKVFRFSRVEFLYMRRVFDSAGPRRARVIARRLLLLPVGLTPPAPWISGFRAQYPACIYPCPTLQVQPLDRPRMARGQTGSLFLSLYDSFIHYSTPVYPDANQSRGKASLPMVKSYAGQETSQTFAHLRDAAPVTGLRMPVK